MDECCTPGLQLWQGAKVCPQGDVKCIALRFSPGIVLKQFPFFFIPNYGCTGKERAAMAQNREPISAEQIRQLQLLAQSLRFGTLTLVFQDGKLIQIDKNEKIRLKSE